MAKSKYMEQQKSKYYDKSNFGQEKNKFQPLKAQKYSKFVLAPQSKVISAFSEA